MTRDVSGIKQVILSGFYSLELQDINRYRTLPLISPTDDPLQFWLLHEHNMKSLSLCAKYLLCIPSSSMPCERTFSEAGMHFRLIIVRLFSDFIFRSHLFRTFQFVVLYGGTSYILQLLTA